MFDLRTLGALDLTSADGTSVGSVLTQPRRAALLCYLALALPRGFHRRDTLFALFWPECGTEQARHALRQSLYVLRRALGSEAIVSRGDDELALAPDRIRCDVWELERAMEDGRQADALALYRGEALAGFHISDAPSFERWLDGERARLAQLAVEAAWALAAAREGEGDAEGAAAAARRAVALAPTDETSARRLILLLQRLGDRPAAVRAYQSFAGKLEGEFELQPSPETVALVTGIRRGVSGERIERFCPPEPPPGGDAPEPDEPARSARDPPLVRRRSRVFAAGALLAVTLIGTGDRPAPGPAIGAGADERVIVADFDSPAADSLLGDAISQALRIDLARASVRVAGAPTVAATLRRMRRHPDTRLNRELAREVALREGIRAVISGEVRRAGGGYVVSAAMMDPATGDLVDGWRESASDSTDLLPAIDRLSASVRKHAGVTLSRMAPGERLPLTTTSSLEALRRQAQASRAMHRGDFARAADLFGEAIRLDSGFAQAYLGLAYALGNLGQSSRRVLDAHVNAYVQRDLLSPPERYAVTANYYAVLGDLPREIEALRHQVEAAKPNREFVLYGSLGGALATAGRLAEAEAVLREARAVYPTAVNQFTLVIVLHRRGKVDEAKAVLREARARFPESVNLSYLPAQMAATSADYVTAETLAAASAEAGDDASGRLLACTAAVRGRVERGVARLRAARDRLLADDRAGEAADLTVAIGRLRLVRGSRSAALAEVERFLRENPPDSLDPVDRPYLALAHFYAEADRTRRARHLLREFTREVPVRFQPRQRAALERAWAAVHLAEGRPGPALEAIERARRAYPADLIGFDATFIGVGEHPELARAYDAAGLADSAIAVYERYLATPAVGRVRLDAFELPDAHFRLAELYERRGRPAEAARSCRRLAALWRDADPALQPPLARCRSGPRG